MVFEECRRVLLLGTFRYDGQSGICESCLQENKTYCDNGIIPSINLIMTYETSACPIGMERIEQVAEYYFG